MRREANFGNTIAEILRKNRREEREKKEFRQWYCPKKKKKLNCSKSNATATHYFTIFFTNCCYDQFLTSSHQNFPITSLFYLLIITHCGGQLIPEVLFRLKGLGHNPVRGRGHIRGRSVKEEVKIELQEEVKYIYGGPNRI